MLCFRDKRQQLVSKEGDMRRAGRNKGDMLMGRTNGLLSVHSKASTRWVWVSRRLNFFVPFCLLSYLSAHTAEMDLSDAPEQFWH